MGQTARGADGLTAEELRRGRQGWWNQEFTNALLASIPLDGGLLVEIGCGLGKVATELLPHLPGFRYLGVDVDQARLEGAREEVRGAVGLERARFVTARGEALPLADEAADCALTAMTLMHVPDTAAVLAEVVRVLRPGGVLIAVEPDNLSQRFYFDGLQEEVTRAFGALAVRSRELRRPADLSVGPRVAGMLASAGFVDVEMRIHATQACRYETAAACAETWRWILGAMAGAVGLASGAPEVAACEAAIAEWLERSDRDQACFCGSTVPMFLTTGRKH